MRVVLNETFEGKSTETVIASLENRDFSVASYLMMEDLVRTSSARFAVDVMLEWFKHDGNSSFTIERTEELDEKTLSYVWSYTA